MSVKLNISRQVARVTIDRPERLNAIDVTAAERLAAIWDEIEDNKEIRCVVLTGTGEKAFSAGADLKDSAGPSGLDYWRNKIEKQFRDLSMRSTLSVPVIARVNGLALGGGFEMVLGCDIVIASDTAFFALPEAKVGRVPLDGGMVTLPRILPRNIALGMMLTGRHFSAADMASYGLVNSVVPMAQLDSETDRWVADIISCAPLSCRTIKSVARGTSNLSIHEAYAAPNEILMAALSSEDAEEGVRAFREKRPPVWRGK
ncbi:MAG: enoyl-CoA hydratase-related protein [Rhodobacteraceae bacterium]|nr:enoyl-CoA hydratase-related protein [Paracoccaceae bacterium]MCY4198099.1 enoyl-CoA hydratase-related protein [Paracoccaceae bacterium]